jgi:hypothetical protein
MASIDAKPCEETTRWDRYQGGEFLAKKNLKAPPQQSNGQVVTTVEVEDRELAHHQILTGN